MKRGYIFGLLGTIVIIAMCVLLLIIANSDDSSKVTKSKVESTTATEISSIKKSIESGAILIDVRTPEEFSLEHAKGASNLPLSDIQNDMTPNVSKETAVYLYCRSGRRATEAKIILEKKGFKNVINLSSLDNWKNIGGVTIKSS